MFLVSRALIGSALGLVAGSFLNVLIHRVPRGETPWRPRRSYCPFCRSPIRARDNVPILSYVWLRGRCRACGERISLRYPLVEGLTGGLFAVTFGTVGDAQTLLSTLALGMFLLTLGMMDVETRRLSDSLVLVGAAVAVALAIWGSFIQGTALRDSLVAGGVGFGVLSAVRWLGRLAFRREAMGGGDPKFLGAIGLFLSDWRLVLLTVGLSAVMGSVVGGFLILLRRERATTAIPYGPFLALGAGAARLWGDKMLELYVDALR